MASSEQLGALKHTPDYSLTSGTYIGCLLNIVAKCKHCWDWFFLGAPIKAPELSQSQLEVGVKDNDNQPCWDWLHSEVSGVQALVPRKNGSCAIIVMPGEEQVGGPTEDEQTQDPAIPQDLTHYCLSL